MKQRSCTSILIKTLFFNFRAFRFKEAIKFPVLLYGRIEIEGVKRGSVVLTKMKAGCVKIGGGWHTDMFGYSNRYKSFIRLYGKLILGEGVIMQQGLLLSINQGAILKIGNNVRFNERVTIHSKMKIEIGDNCRVGWNTQILDTGFHYMVNKGRLTYRDAPVFLGHNVWVANSCSIMKGTWLPAYTVVASNSLVNKNYVELGEHYLIGGVPAKPIAEGVERLILRDSEVDKLFITPDDILYWDDIKEELNKEKYHKQ